MPTINFFGCSLTSGAELSEKDNQIPFPEDMKYLWTYLIADWLGYKHQNWARSGASCEDIALSAIESMYNANNGDLFVVAWTWPMRYNYWQSDLVADDEKSLIVSQHHLTHKNNKEMHQNSEIFDNSDIIDFTEKYIAPKKIVIDYLKHVMLVNNTAKMLGLDIINIQIGTNVFDLNTNDWFSTQTIPNSEYSLYPAQYNTTTKLINHPLLIEFNKIDMLYSGDGLWNHMLNKWDTNFEDYLNGYHWNKKGCQYIANELVKNYGISKYK